MISLLIADDHHLVRQGIRSLLEEADDIRVVAEAADGLQAVKLVQKYNPDVLVTDIFMPKLNGTQVIEHLHRLKLKTRTIILSMYKDQTLIHQTMKIGASGYLLKSAVFEELLIAVRAAVRGEIYLSPEISTILINSGIYLETDRKADSENVQFSLREREVLKLIAEGNTNRKVAEILNLSERTVEHHRANLMKKAGVSPRDLAGIIRLAMKLGLIPVRE